MCPISNRATTMKIRALLAVAAALFLATGTAQAAGVEYVCGDCYSIVIEPEDRTIDVFDGRTQTRYKEIVTKGITINGDNEAWTAKTLPRNKKGKVAVRGIPCKKLNQG